MTRSRNNHSLLIITAFLAMLGLVLWWNVTNNIQTFRAHQLEIAQQSVNGAASEITLLIEGLETSVQLLMHGHQKQLQRLAQDPDNAEVYDDLARVLGRYFPDYYTFTIADTDGKLLYDDFGENLGRLCLSDLKSFATGAHLTNIYIHPGPSIFHFDIMLPWNPDPSLSGIFFVGFKPELIARLLRNSTSPGHQLILVRSDTKDLIEITPVGSRDKLQRPNHLSEQEQKSILYSKSIKATKWRLVDLPDVSLFTNQRSQTVTQASAIMVIILIVSAIMLWRNRREESQRASIEAQMHKLSSVVEQTDDIVLVTNHDGLIEYVNPAFEKKTGYQAKEMLGHKPQLISSGQHDAAFYKNLWSTISSGEVFRSQFINRNKAGQLFYEEKTITPLKNDQGRITHYVSTGKDITEQIEAQERLHHMAHHDVLTGLPNRALLADRLNHTLARARRNETLVAVLLMDLDRFKTINDSLGHNIGDILLKTVANRLRECLRNSDSIARLGGDEFVSVLEGVDGVHDVTVVLEKILKVIAQPFYVEGYVLQTSASIGVTLYPFDDDDIETLLKSADTAMYRAKKAGGNTYAFFTNSMSQQASRRQVMESQLRHALERQQFTLHYQPRIDLRVGRATGVEALLRWHNPDTRPVSPAEFIPVLEETGLILTVGEWVLRTACRDHQAMAEAGDPSLRVSVNLSPRQFQQVGLVDTVAQILQETGFDPRRLELEITENLLIDNIDEVISTLCSLHDLGIHIAIDDFGTGYSALSYLKRFPIDVLKVDRAFVQDLTDGPDNVEIVKAIIAMAHSLRMEVVAEGVETQEQLQLLQELACEEIQGYLFSPALSLDDLKAWLYSHKDLTKKQHRGQTVCS